MAIKKEPFRRYNEKKREDTFTVKLNKEERNRLEEDKKFLQQTKDSTAIKQLAEIGSEVLRNQKIKKLNQIVLNNYRKNKRLGIVDFD